MCQQQMPVNQANKSSGKNNNNNSNNKMKQPTYSIKKVLKAFFKKHQHQKHQPSSGQLLSNSMESLESLENYRNMQTEQQQFYIEIDENSANEKIAEIVQEHELNVYVPVRFARTEAGTFFWTTNLQPVTSSIIPTAGDEDLVQPAYCYSTHQYPLVQYQDRWAQA